MILIKRAINKLKHRRKSSFVTWLEPGSAHVNTSLSEILWILKTASNSLFFTYVPVHLLSVIVGMIHICRWLKVQILLKWYRQIVDLNGLTMAERGNVHLQKSTKEKIKKFNQLRGKVSIIYSNYFFYRI